MIQRTWQELTLEIDTRIKRALLQFQKGQSGAASLLNALATFTGDLLANARVGVRKNAGGSTYKRRRINFIEGDGVSIVIGDSSANEEIDIYMSATGYNSAYPTHATMWHDEAKVITGNPLVVDQNAAYPYGIVAAQAVEANGDAFEQTFRLAAGEYVFAVDGYKNTDCGIIDWALNGSTLVAGQDWYDGVGALAIQSNNVTVTDGGLHTLRGTVNGKNASSSSYVLSLTKYWFRPQ